MRSDENQRSMYEFILARFKDQQPFDKDDVKATTTLAESSFDTYWSKQLRQLFVPAPSKKFRVGEAFRPLLPWEKFQQHVTQVRRVSSDYSSFVHRHVVVFDFFLPLAQEEHLRRSLDALFYLDTIRTKLRIVELESVKRVFPQDANETDANFYERVALWIARRFGGYSISHVSGRFRAAGVLDQDAAFDLQREGGRYLVDETTAVVRFIFPCGSAERSGPPFHAEDIGDDDAASDDSAFLDAEKVRWAFRTLFVQSIVQVVNGEAEIWMMESGMRSRLHMWRVEDDEEA